LKEFCCVEDTTIHVSAPLKQVDPYLTFRNEGRRQVFLHIMKLAGLTYRDIERVRSIDEMEQARTQDAEVFGS
jgi:hypothetical protein